MIGATSQLAGLSFSIMATWRTQHEEPPPPPPPPTSYYRHKEYKPANESMATNPYEMHGHINSSFLIPRTKWDFLVASLSACITFMLKAIATIL